MSDDGNLGLFVSVTRCCDILYFLNIPWFVVDVWPPLYFVLTGDFWEPSLFALTSGLFENVCWALEFQNS